MTTLIFKSQKLHGLIALTQGAKYFTANFSEQITAFEKDTGEKYDFKADQDLKKYQKHQNPTIWFVKDEGIYLMASSAEYKIPKDRSHICYAEGFEPNVPGSWERCRAAVGGDDFCESLPFSKDIQELVRLGGDILIKVTSTSLIFEVVKPKSSS